MTPPPHPGHTLVPQAYPKLGEWVKRQRRCYKFLKEGKKQRKCSSLQSREVMVELHLTPFAL